MTKSTTENTNKQCNFPAIQLRAYRAELTEEIKKLEERDETWPRIRPILQAILAADKAYDAHYELTGCLCWNTDAEIAAEFREQNYHAWLKEHPELATPEELYEMGLCDGRGECDCRGARKAAK
jgi:hypothetical protein